MAPLHAAVQLLPILLLILLLDVEPFALRAGTRPQGLLYPDVSIAAWPKAGTSHLYQLLKTHTDTFALPKEMCPRKNNVNPSEYARLVDKKLASRRGDSTTVTVNACPLPEEMLRYHRIVLPARAKYICVVRDPADHAWAAYNFWIDPQTDANTTGDPQTHNWARLGVHYRSPAHFHELVLAGGALRTDLARRSIRTEPLLKLRGAAGAENFLILRSEDMSSSRPNVLNHTLARIAAFTGLRVGGFDPKVASAVTNSGTYAQIGRSRGINAVVQMETNGGIGHGLGRYEISGFRPMMEATRELLYDRFCDLCRELRDKFGVVYQECIDAPRASSLHGVGEAAQRG